MNSSFEYFDALDNLPFQTIDGVSNADFEYFDLLGNILVISFSTEEPQTVIVFGPLIQCI